MILELLERLVNKEAYIQDCADAIPSYMLFARSHLTADRNELTPAAAAVANTHDIAPEDYKEILICFSLECFKIRYEELIHNPCRLYKRNKLPRKESSIDEAPTSEYTHIEAQKEDEISRYFDGLSPTEYVIFRPYMKDFFNCMKNHGQKNSGLNIAINKIIEAVKSNNLQGAETMATGVLSMNPHHAQLLLITSSIKLLLPNKSKEGFALLKRALEASTSPDSFLNLALDHFYAKRMEIAEEVVVWTLQRYPDCYNAFNILGVILKHQERFADSVEVLTKASKLNPDEASAWNNMGNTYMAWHSYENALRAFSQAVLLAPDNPEFLRMQAAATIKLGRYEEALPTLEKSLSLAPNKVDSHIELCSAYYHLRDYEKALETVLQGLASAPDNIPLLRAKAMVLRPMGRVHEAIPLLEKILISAPNDVQVMLALANAYYYTLGDNQTARKYYFMAYELEPNNLALLQKICHFLITVRSANESESVNLGLAHELVQKLLNLSHDPLPFATTAQSIFLSTLDYDNYTKLNSNNNLLAYWASKRDNSALSIRLSRVKTLEDRMEILSAHRAWGEQEEEIARKDPIVHKVRQRFDNKIRIGIMSADLRNHPVGYFAWPIVEHLDRSKFEIFCYSFFPHDPCTLQQAFMENVTSFKNYRIESNKEVAQSIADDHLDIMFELGGTTSYNRISVCAHKPAPIQVSWLGYPHSIGLPTAIDYIMIDPYIKPDNPALLIEKQFVMPKTWVVIEDKIGFKATPILSSIPEDRNGYITLGTLNTPHKLTIEAFKTWAEIMHMIPNSRFLYVRPETDVPVFRDNFLKHMAAYGISADRISFGATRTAHLDYYNNIDIAMDTFPHTGGTTTCEALWMGVPVVTLVGLSFFERISYSNLNNAGLGDLCTFSTEEYKSKVLQLVYDKARRIYLRNNLRQQILNNPLGQPAQFAHDFGQTVTNTLGRG